MFFGFSRPYFRVLAGIFPYFTNKFKDLTKKKKRPAISLPRAGIYFNQ